ncbi:hypothetical protein FSP39_022112 [Pinctada imbricata]|uniref:Uncharacterized protein n=1 Tax=Pinctada imbricata TaxID=66713 RepID=A0AA88YMH7_PINIB|nr:hypothetical protein FSP39_022112 [Pinctada imbricata]
MAKPALYEAAVQICKRGRRFVLYNKFSAGFTSASWEQRLLGGKDIRSQVDKLIDKECKIFLRRIPLTKKGSSKVAELLKKYDYAWSKVPRQRKVYRRVEKSGMVISNDDM